MIIVGTQAPLTMSLLSQVNKDKENALKEIQVGRDSGGLIRLA